MAQNQFVTKNGLISRDDVYVIGNITASNIISASAISASNIYGTSSWSNNSTTASYVSASSVNGTVSSASYSLSSSYSLNSSTASYYGGNILNNQLPSQINVTSVTASFTGSLIGTSSWSSNSLTASYASGSGIYAISSSYSSVATSASYSNNSTSASYSLSSSYSISSSYALSSSYGVSSSYSSNSNSASYSLSSSYALNSTSASYAPLVTGDTYNITSSWAQSASNALFSVSSSYLSGGNTAYVSALSASNVYVDGGTVTAGTFTTPNVKINNDIIVTGSLTVLSTASFLSQSSFILNTSDPFYLANNPTIVLSNSPNNTLGIKGALIVGPNGNGTNWCRLNNDGTSDFGGGQIHFNSNGSGYFNGNIGIGNLTYSTTNTLNVYGNVFANSYTGSLSGSVTGNLLGTASYSNSSSYLSGNVAKIIPVSDATVDLGSISNRFNGLYAVQSTIGAFFEVGLRTIGIGQNPTGTIVTWRNGKLVPSDTEEDSLVMGVVWQGKDEPIIIGAETILVTGKVEEGDYIVTSNKIGHGKAIKRGNFFKNDLFGKVIAQALESSNEDSKLIKAMIRKM